ncbi:MAG: glycosyltransferase family 4 protein [Pyrinomonadaceae bacterium]
MKVLLLNQCFYPDVAATAQLLTDLAVAFSKQGHEVTVITGRRGYDTPEHSFAARETYQGIKIVRIRTPFLGKSSRLRRAVNFGIFLVNCALRLLLMPHQDAVIALTSPPLISLLGGLFVRLKGGRFYFWVMDLNPDEAIAAGWLKKESRTARVLERLLRYSMWHAENIFVLDRFMRDRIEAKGISSRKLVVISPWSHDQEIQFDEQRRRDFRAAHDLSKKFVVMYSGNHSPCHPLDTLLAAAESLQTNSRIVFCFAGGGSEKLKVEQFASTRGLENIKCFPYQPLAQLSASLSAADLHVVVMGEPFVGIVHPCKLYNILRVGAPLLYIGPRESHVSDVAAESGQMLEFYGARHGEVELVASHILAAARRQRAARTIVRELAEKFSSLALVPHITAAVEKDELVKLMPDAESRVRIA